MEDEELVVSFVPVVCFFSSSKRMSSHVRTRTFTWLCWTVATCGVSLNSKTGALRVGDMLSVSKSSGDSLSFIWSPAHDSSKKSVETHIVATLCCRTSTCRRSIL